MKLGKIIVPALALLALAACGPTEAASTSSENREEKIAAAERALRGLPYSLQGTPGSTDREFDLVMEVTSGDYTFSVDYAMEETLAYPGSSATIHHDVISGCGAIYGYIGDEIYWLGSYGNNVRIQVSGEDYIGDSGQSYARLFATEPTKGTDKDANQAIAEGDSAPGTYKLGIYQYGTDTFYYLSGKTLTSGSFRTASLTENWEDALDVTVEASGSGFSMLIDGEYLGLANVDGYNNPTFSSTPFTWGIYADTSHDYVTCVAGYSGADVTNTYAVYRLTASISDGQAVLASAGFNVRIDSVTPLAIADLFDLNAGETVVTVGKVTGFQETDARYMFVGDGDVGITVYGTGVKDQAKVGDVVIVSGEYTIYNGLPEINWSSITPMSADEIADNAIASALVEPTTVTLDENNIPNLERKDNARPATVTGYVYDRFNNSDGTSVTLNLSFGSVIDSSAEDENVTFTVYCSTSRDGQTAFNAMNAAKVGDNVTVEGWISYYNGFQLIGCTTTINA